MFLQFATEIQIKTSLRKHARVRNQQLPDPSNLVGGLHKRCSFSGMNHNYHAHAQSENAFPEAFRGLEDEKGRGAQLFETSISWSRPTPLEKRMKG